MNQLLEIISKIMVQSPKILLGILIGSIAYWAWLYQYLFNNSSIENSYYRSISGLTALISGSFLISIIIFRIFKNIGVSITKFRTNYRLKNEMNSLTEAEENVFDVFLNSNVRAVDFSNHPYTRSLLPSVELLIDKNLLYVNLDQDIIFITDFAWNYLKETKKV
jgi:hypothetical protein